MMIAFTVYIALNITVTENIESGTAFQSCSNTSGVTVLCYQGDPYRIFPKKCANSDL